MNLFPASQRNRGSEAFPSSKKISKENTHTIFFVCGILSSLLYVGMNIFVPMQFDGYDSASQTVSELSAIGVPTRQLWIMLGTLFTLLIVAFGWGIIQSAFHQRQLFFVGVFIFIYGIISLFWPFVPMHQRVALAAGGKTLSDTMHLVLTMLTVIAMALALVFGSMAFGLAFRVYSIVTLLVLFAFGLLTALNAHRVEANLPTPLTGIWERINIGVFLLWVIVLALTLMKRQKVWGRN